MDESEFDQEVRLEYYRSGVQATREVGVFALKTIVTLNSGAFVVLLTFIGNSAASSQFIVPIENLKLAMFLFLTGIALAFLAVAYTYYASQSMSPYPQPKRMSDGWFVPVVLSVTCLAFLAFVIGVVAVVSGVNTAA